MSKPAVDGLQRDVSNTITVLRVNILDSSGRVVADRYRVDLVPSFLLFHRGELVARVSGRVPSAAELRATLSG